MGKMEQIFIIGDVHGCYKTLLALIKQLPQKFDSKICFVGDLIDRGNSSADVIELIKSQNYDCVMGNHEYRLLAYESEFIHGGKVSDERWFYMHGGEQTFKSYKDKSVDFRRSHVKFLKNLPLFLEYDLATNDGKRLVVSHSAVGQMWWLRNSDANYADFRRHLLCGRDDTHENKDIFNVFGHTPTPTPIITRYYANIDTGCIFNNSRGNTLTALSFPDFKIYSQANIENS
ncbi:Bis(5'-nucleosyl)-tetraphosphatase PrpE [asymmetrical] [Campylobacter majalis]|uniref:Bis(5'-nucleosyl)-tetraphosphatase PrpE [asymmetrical] n=1 Tax=Campylobacter majalis TaxID=2790656 RepID=A0ABM8Q4E3_9BACT|nr:metallophosphoesterase [Campylobacter majalis]CAD7287647.1 Bis(5'-nucleosyl)-tetraphosphatase PrpE [asymmetrical] [Campylobacter majalis]